MSTQGSQAGASSSSGRAPRVLLASTAAVANLCDGARPVCGSCLRTGRESDCEYTDGLTRSPTQVLEDNIARLEARIYELEHPETVVPSVTLHDPRVAPTQWALSLTEVVLPPAGANTTGGQLHPSQGNPPISIDPTTEPPVQIVQTLVNSFLPHVSQFGFSLYHARFRASITIPDARARQARLSPALLNAVYLWGAHLASDSALRAHAPAFLQRAVHAVATALAHGHNVVHSIQAEVLLAHYFFAQNRTLEGRYHCSAAVALALSCGLNKLTAGGGPGALHPPADAAEAGERINIFWAVFVLDKSWAVTAGSPAHFDGRLGLAWRHRGLARWRSTSAFGGVPQGVVGQSTVQAFLAHGPGGSANVSIVALRAQAATLFERATRLAAQWNPTMINSAQFAADIIALESVIDSFTAALPRLQIQAHMQDVERARQLLVVHTYARVATIQVHGVLKHAQGVAPGKDVMAARAAVTAIEEAGVAQMGCIDPIMAILWTVVCRTLIGEIGRLRALWTSASRSAVGNQAAMQRQQLQQAGLDHTAFMAMLQTVLGAMGMFGGSSPLMVAQAAKVRQELEGAGKGNAG